MERDGLRVSVTDQGPGLDPSELDHLFERFDRGRTARQASFGTGMGLSITRGLLAAAGGRVWARTGLARERDFGSRAWASPRSHGDAVAMAARILIVDDEPNILGTVAPLLRARGYDVVSAMTGRAALEAVERDKPDLIVLDLGLPDFDGVEVCRQVRQTVSVPILVLSARGAEGDKVRALDAGADDYVTKPFGAEELLARICASLRRVEILAAERADRARRPGHRPGTFSRAQRRRGSAVDAQGIRVADISGPASRTRADPSHHPQGHLGHACRRSAGAYSGARRVASQEDRAEPGVPNTSSRSRGSATDSRMSDRTRSAPTSPDFYRVAVNPRFARASRSARKLSSHAAVSFRFWFSDSARERTLCCGGTGP